MRQPIKAIAFIRRRTYNGFGEAMRILSVQTRYDDAA